MADDPAALVQHHDTGAPDVDGDRCVHGLSPIAQCRACVASCPQTAILLDDDGLSIDTSSCDSCGLCVAVCPQQAIALDRMSAPPVHDRDEISTAYMACDRVAMPGSKGNVPCLNAISTSQLARLHRSGVRRLAIAHEECRHCSRNAKPDLRDRVSDLARLLSDRELEQMTVLRLEAKTWRRDIEDAAKPNRRALFRAVLGRGTPMATASPPETAGGIIAAGALLDARSSATLAESTPEIEQATCTACGACVEICPHAAIASAGEGPDERQPAYVIDATACTGCGLCINACDVGAVTLVPWGRAHPPPVKLARGRCRGCGANYLNVPDGSVAADLCRICAATHHRKNLFQVLS